MQGNDQTDFEHDTALFSATYVEQLCYYSL